MRLFRSVVVCSAVTLVLGLAPSVAGPAFAAGALVASPATVPATAGQVLPLAALFQPIPRGSFPSFQYVNVVVTLSGGLTASDGGQTIAAQGPTALLTVLGIPVTAKSSGRATLRVTALDNNVPISDDATTTVEVPTPATAPASVPPTTAGATGAPAASGNRPPTAVGKGAVVRANTATAIGLKGTDPEGATLVYSVVDFPENGRLTGRAPNLTYVPEKGFVGADAFTFTVSDRVSTSEEAVISITVISAKKAVVRRAVKKKK